MQKRNTAAAIKKAVGKAFVYASRDKELLEAADVLGTLKKQVTHASFGCTDCGTSMIVDASMQPLCITCGSHNVNLTEAKTDINVKSDSELTAVVCGQCKHYNVVQSKVIEASGHSMYCTACGNPLVLAEAGPADPNEPMKLDPDANVSPDALKSVETPPKPQASLTNVENVPVPEGGDPAVLKDGGTDPSMVTPDVESADADEMPDNDYGDEEEEEASTLTLSEAEDDGDEDEDDDKPAFLKDKEDADFVSAEDFGMDGDMVDPMMDLDNDVAEDVNADLPFEADDAGDPLMDSMDLDDTDMSLSFVQASGRLIAMKGPVAVATLTSVRAAGNADIMETAAFHNAISYAAKTKGLRKALAAFGFKPIRVQVMSQAKVNSEKSKLLQQAKADRAKFMKKLEQSLALAAVGLARNRWQERSNVLADALVSELQATGMRNPKPMIARILTAQGVPFTKQLITIADTLMKMPDATRAAMADVMAMTRENAEDILEDDTDGATEEGLLDQDFDSITSRVSASSIVSKSSLSDKHSVTAQDVLRGSAKLSFASDF